MARQPGDRYPTARELADDLRRFQTGQLVGAHRYTIGQLARRWLRKHRTTVAVACAAVVLLAVLGVLSVTRIVREQQHASAERRLAEKSRAEAVSMIVSPHLRSLQSVRHVAFGLLLFAAPASHCSPFAMSMMPLPQVSSDPQFAEQPSPEIALPSSHTSALSRIVSPQRGS